MDLARFKRRRYTEGFTPLEFLPNFTQALGGPNVFIKRDDMLGLAPGGNKTRKLEFLVADALAQGADTLITCGAVQSNHCRLTLAAAAREGLKCQMVLEERVANSYDLHANGNNFMFRLMGVERIKVVPGGADINGAMQSLAEDLDRAGRKAYIIPGGGSNALGALGYVAAAQEILAQTFEKGLQIDRIVLASGSSGTHAGMVVGLHAFNADIPVIGIGVSRDPEQQVPLVRREAEQTAQLLGLHGGLPEPAIVTNGQYWRPKYSVPNARMVEAVQILARTEAILLDPTYTGKAMAGLIGLSREGVLKPGENVLFLHTGGLPALYASMAAVLGEEPVAD